MKVFTPIKNLHEIPTFQVQRVQISDDRGPIRGAFSLQRSDTRSHFGFCSERYRPIQLEEMVEVVDKASKDVGGIDHIGYTFSRSGKRVIIQSKLTESFDINGDIVDGLFYTIVDNTGMSANKIIPSTRRLVCTNQLHILNRARGESLNHNYTFDEKVEIFSRRFRSNIEELKGFNITAERLQAAKFSLSEMSLLVAKLFPAKEDKLTSKTIEKRADVMNRFTNGIGNEGKTRWDALNAVTEFTTHTGRPSSERVVRELMLGDVSSKAFKLLTNG